MKRIHLIAALLLILLQIRAAGQAIGINQRDAITDRGLVLQYENDAFGNTDYYYSQGVTLTFTHPSLKKNPLSRLLLHFKEQHQIYGLNFEHDAYTPTSILSDTIRYGDRPYAASVMLQSFATSINQEQHTRLTAALTLGLLGPGAGGEEIQALIHRNTGNDIPHGWQYQIANDAILNYSVTYEKGLLALKYLALTAALGADAGTYWDKGYASLNIKAGLMNLPLFSEDQRAFQLYIEDKPRAAVVGYDATLQGGLFNRKSPYTISSGSINRATFRNDVAVYLSYHSILLSASYTALTKEFKTGRNHAWGGFTAAVRF